MVNNFIEGFKEGQKAFGENFAAIVNLILLSVVYFLGVGGTSITAKIFGKHFLDLRTEKNIKTYWTELNLKKKEKEEYYRQF